MRKEKERKKAKARIKESAKSDNVKKKRVKMIA
jgi:hypothetical protein